jgi:hypothetical protein
MKSARVGPIHFFWPAKTLMRSAILGRRLAPDERAARGREPQALASFAGDGALRLRAGPAEPPAIPDLDEPRKEQP